MALKTVDDLKTNVSSILTGIDLDQVIDLEGSIERAVSTFIQKADVLEASARLPIMLYDRVFDYGGLDDIFGGALIDLRPQGIDREVWEDVVKIPINRFDRTKIITPSGYRVTFEQRSTQLITRIAQDFAETGITIDGMSSTDGWAVGGDGSGLALDQTVYYHQPGALRFNLAAEGSQATLTKTLDNPLELSAYSGVGVVFLAVYMPNASSSLISSITSLVLRIGSSDSAYYSVSNTEGFTGAFYANDYFLVPFDLAGAIATGSPDMSAAQYVQLIVNYDGTAMANMRMGDLFIALPSPHEALYYSPAVFVHDGVASAEITDGNDTIKFRSASYNIFVQEAAREIAKNQGGDVGSGLVKSIDLVLDGVPGKPGLYTRFIGDNPSEEIRQTGNYYYDS